MAKRNTRIGNMISFTIALILFGPAAPVVFSQNQNQYPDTIVECFNSTTKSHGKFFGGTETSWQNLVAPTCLLTKNDSFITLPKGSYLIVGFTDNFIVDAPGQNDIFIQEFGGAGEYADVLVSADNVDYKFLGTAGAAAINEFDLAQISYTGCVKYIKVVGLDSKGQSPGFDLVTVYGLPGASRKTEEIIVLENVLFETNRSVLLDSSFRQLDDLTGQLTRNESMRIEIRGHTDNTGNEEKNRLLSAARAKAVQDYLVSKGIQPERLSYKGFGSMEPIASNNTEEGRSKNRRVEFLILTK